MSTLTQQLVDFWGSRTAQAIGAVVILGLGGYTLLYDTGTFALVSGVMFLSMGLLMLYELLAGKATS
ncbi:hypothetical protein [Saliphagus infecundisoli]|uniref:Uncharacterized protein n=1 Tax=Saliphagus infecundisoli TaxID=1849069 RepID=A0ABD5QHK8_9EURY|nr:hypothetical protein [Saliphagus infecundisoli]